LHVFGQSIVCYQVVCHTNTMWLEREQRERDPLVMNFFPIVPSFLPSLDGSVHSDSYQSQLIKQDK
jgi:hypothetical protein